MLKRIVCLVRGHVPVDTEVETTAAEGVPGRTFCTASCERCGRRISWVYQEVSA